MEGPGDHARILSAAVHSEIPAQKVLTAVVLEAVLSYSVTGGVQKIIGIMRKSNLIFRRKFFDPHTHKRKNTHTTNKTKLKRGLLRHLN